MSAIGSVLREKELARRSRGMKWLASAGSLGLILFILLTAVDVFCFDLGFFDRIYNRLGTAETIGVSEDDLHQSTVVLLDYLRDERDDIEVPVTLLENGQQVTMFNERESQHMEDVKILYRNAMAVRWFSLGFAAALFLVLLIRYKRRAFGFLWAGYRIALIVFGLALLAIGLFAALDFNRFWTLFHQVFFSNDLWLLDPATDRMILMVPSYFFSQLVFRITAAAAAAMAGAGILFWLLARLLAKPRK